ncbi:hypothetical protein GCM10017744_011260 [Streptomyces antimycoticus]
MPEKGGVHLQVEVGEADASGFREVSVFSREEAEGEGAAWVRHAHGVVGSAAPVSGTQFDFGVWPPAGAEPVDVSGEYVRAAENGLEYGPVFQGLKHAWRREGEVFAEVELPEAERDRAGQFGLHPALFDAALHAMGVSESLAGGSGSRLPFSWRGFALEAVGATSLRVRLASADAGSDAVSVLVGDESGRVVASVESLVLRPVDADQLKAAGGAAREALFRVEWVDAPGAVVAGGEAAPRAEVMRLVSDGVDVVGEAYGRVLEVLERAQDWLADEDRASERLVVVTRGAVDVGDGVGVWDLAGPRCGVWCGPRRRRIPGVWCWWTPMTWTALMVFFRGCWLGVRSSWWCGRARCGCRVWAGCCPRVRLRRRVGLVRVRCWSRVVLVCWVVWWRGIWWPGMVSGSWCCCPVVVRRPRVRLSCGRGWRLRAPRW